MTTVTAAAGSHLAMVVVVVVAVAVVMVVVVVVATTMGLMVLQLTASADAIERDRGMLRVCVLRIGLSDAPSVCPVACGGVCARRSSALCCVCSVATGIVCQVGFVWAAVTEEGRPSGARSEKRVCP